MNSALASSSRSVLRTARQPIVSARPAAFSTSSAHLARKRTVTVELLQSIPSLGAACESPILETQTAFALGRKGKELSPDERVEVAPGWARNHLVPNWMARYVPWKTPADRRAPRAEVAHTESQTPRRRSAPVPPVTTPEQIAALANLPTTLTFQHRTISPSFPSIHGSVTLADVSARLAELGLTGSEVSVEWVGRDASERMKELGRWEAVVHLTGTEQRRVIIEVARLQ